jgi:hemolysin activation/secretion protein
LYREYVSIFPRHVLLLGLLFDFYSSPTIFENELYRFGGLNSLRGFNEEQLFASTKGQLTFEYRFLLDENSNVFLFYDQCFYENSSVNYYNDHPLGFGGGISFGSKIGVFSITYALGRELANPIDFRSSKIHFGYTAYF